MLQKTLTFDPWPPKFNRLVLESKWRFYQIFRNSLKVLQRYCVYKAKTVCREVTVTLTCDLRPLKSYEFILESNGHFQSLLRNCVYEHGNRHGQSENSGSGCWRPGGIKQLHSNVSVQKSSHYDPHNTQFSLGLLISDKMLYMTTAKSCWS